MSLPVLPLAQRLQRTEDKSFTGLFSVGVPYAFDGFAQLAGGMAYLPWLARQIRAIYSQENDPPYEVMVHHADKLIHDESWAEDGYDLLYQLLIEPFCLIDCYEKECERS